MPPKRRLRYNAAFLLATHVKRADDLIFGHHGTKLKGAASDRQHTVLPDVLSFGIVPGNFQTINDIGRFPKKVCRDLTQINLH